MRTFSFWLALLFVLLCPSASAQWFMQRGGTPADLCLVPFKGANTETAFRDVGAILHSREGGSTRLTQEAETATLRGVTTIDANNSIAGGATSVEDSTLSRHPLLAFTAGIRPLICMECRLSAELYVVTPTLSIIAGAGYFPEIGTRPATWSYAAALRVYAGHKKTRTFFQVSISVLTLAWHGNPGKYELYPPDYGPALEIGRCYIADSGFTASAQAGAGYALRNRRPTVILMISVGYVPI